MFDYLTAFVFGLVRTFATDISAKNKFVIESNTNEIQNKHRKWRKQKQISHKLLLLKLGVLACLCVSRHTKKPNQTDW